MTATRLIHIPKIEDPRGNLSFIEHGAAQIIPFEIGAVKWAYDIRSGHIHSREERTAADEVILALGGSFTVTICPGENQETSYTLLDPAVALYVPKGLNLRFSAFSANSTALIISAHE